MKINILVADITTLEVDVIVNAANPGLARGAGVCGAIFAAADKGTPGDAPGNAGMLQIACDKFTHGVHTGNAVATEGFGLPAKYIIHAVGPVYQDGNCGEEILLSSAYTKSLETANHLGCKTIAFPAISTGVYGYPPEEATAIALIATMAFDIEVAHGIEEVTFACFDAEMEEVYQATFHELKGIADLFDTVPSVLQS